MLTFEQAEEKYSKLNDLEKSLFRKVATGELRKDLEGSGQGIGSSDIYCQSISLMQRTEGNWSELVDINWELSEEGYT